MYQEKQHRTFKNDGDFKMNRILNSRRQTTSLFVLFRISMKHTTVIQQCILLLMLSCVSGKQRFALQPLDQNVIIGSRVTLPCRIENKVGIVQWTKDNFGLGVDRELHSFDRYKMIGSDDEGEYSLDIRNSTLEDDGIYQCQVSAGSDDDDHLRSHFAHLIILKPPDPPKITQGPVLLCIEDREIDLECVSNNGKPAPEINWVDNSGAHIKDGVTYISQQIEDRKDFNARSILHFRPTRKHNNHIITCQAQNLAEKTHRSTSILLKVQYAPRARMYIKIDVARGNNTINQTRKKIQEGDTIIIGCEANANPNNITYKWYINREPILGDLRNELVLANISKNLHRAIIKCEAYNIIGKSSDSKTLSVIYGPYIKVKPQSVEGETGSLVTMTCVVEGYPSPKITWLRFEKDRFITVGKSSNLTVTVSPHTSGTYWCKGSMENRGHVESSANVYIRGPPKITSNHTQYGDKGRTLKIECVTFSIPKPDYISWSYRGIEISSFSNHEYACLEETLGGGLMKSTLIVHKSEARHFGIYNCTVVNPYGMDSVEIEIALNSESHKPIPLELIIWVCGVIFLILLIMLFTMLRHRKSNKVDKMKPDVPELKIKNLKDGDDTSNISDLKMELRQVSGSITNSPTDSVTDLHPTHYLTSNLGLPLAGPVSFFKKPYETELQRAYRRYSGDFNQPISSLNRKNHTQTTGYVAYVDYSRDYAPPATDSLSGSLSRSIDGTYPSQGSLRRQTNYGRFGGSIGPDVIPYSNRGTVLNDVGDFRYAATCGNPFLRGVDSLTYKHHIQTNISGKYGPTPYQAGEHTDLHINLSNLASPCPPSPAPSLSPRPRTRPSASTTTLTNNGAQPQVPKPSFSGALYIQPPSNKGNVPSNQRIKGNGTKKVLETNI